MAKLPLEGIRVLDLGVVLAGPHGAMLLADMGAEVIKVETIQTFQTWLRGHMAHPPESHAKLFDYPRGNWPDGELGKRPWNRELGFNTHGQNKLSMTVDLRKPKGMDIFKRLVNISDVVHENNAPSTMDKLGITYEMLRQVKPDIIYIRMSAFGNTGPYRGYVGYAQQLESLSGHDVLRGYPDMDPTTNTLSAHSDTAVGAMSVFAVLAALHYRERTGKGQFIDMSMQEVMVGQLAEAIIDASMNGRVMRTMGNREPSVVQGCYQCQGEDRWVTISITSDEEWEGFCRALGNPPWAKDERFSDILSRYKNHDALDKLIKKWTVEHDYYEVMHRLQKEGVPAGAVIDNERAQTDPHLLERHFFEIVTHPEVGTMPHPGMSFKMSKTPLSVRRPAPLLGEHNEYVYKKLLGVSDEEYAQLEAEGHIGMDYAPHVL